MSEFDSPSEAKEFPGLYCCKAEGNDKDMMSDTAEYDEESDKKKKKKAKDKEKGYATLAGESSHDEDDPTGADPKSPGKKKSKGFKLSSGKKKDKDKDVKDGKKAEKEKKSDKEKAKKFSDLIERKSADRDIAFISSVRIPFSADRHRDVNSHRSSVPSAFLYASSTPKNSITSNSVDKPEVGESTNPNGTVNDHGGKPVMSAFNAFLGAPAPIFHLPKKKDKDRKKDKDKEKDSKENKKSKEKKEHSSSGVAKVKLKLMRSKNSLEDSSGSDLHVSVSHQFPEDPDSLTKEIRKYEQLLEQTHLQIKSSKKVSKKQEEQLWELQRTLTQLKRKLRSINALSCASVNLNFHHQQGSSSAKPDSSGESSLPSIQSIPPPPSNSTEHHDSLPKVPVPVEEVAEKQQSNNDNNNIRVNLARKAQDCVDAQGAFKTAISTSLESPPSLANTTHTKGIAEKSFSNESENDIPGGGSVSPENFQFRSPAVRRSLDFSEIVVDNKTSNNDSTEVTSPSAIPLPTSRKGSRDVDLVQSTIRTTESPVEHEKVEVHVLVHNESREEVSSPGTEDDPDEALPSISSRNEENIDTVLNDANAMIGSMHEELEAAALVFGQRKLSHDHEDVKGYDFAFNRNDGMRHNSYKNKVSKSEPTFGDQANNDSSDIELIRDDDDEDVLENFTDELIPEILELPVFLTDEYISYENEQLILFNVDLENKISKEEEDIDRLMQELDDMQTNGYASNGPDSLDDDLDSETLLSMWQAAKLENEVLHENVSKLRQMLALDLLEEFKLETRLRYLEDKVLPISPLTTTTPLQPET